MLRAFSDIVNYTVLPSQHQPSVRSPPDSISDDRLSAFRNPVYLLLLTELPIGTLILIDLDLDVKNLNTFLSSRSLFEYTASLVLAGKFRYTGWPFNDDLSSSSRCLSGSFDTTVAGVSERNTEVIPLSASKATSTGLLQNGNREDYLGFDVVYQGNLL